MLLGLNVQAIVIRHDKGFVKYQAEEANYPAVFFLERQRQRKVCVATLIHPQWAITAAHCVAETSLGETLASGRNFEVQVGGQPRHIDKIVIHPNYIPASAEEVDLALLHFETTSSQPLPLIINRRTDELNQVVTLLGWGFFGIGTTGRQYDDAQFRRAQNRITVAHRRLHIKFDNPTKAGDEALELEGVPGLGDSGGPALFETSGVTTVVGVAVGELKYKDYNDEFQGRYGAVIVYERLTRHWGWIQTVISSKQQES